MLFLKLDQTGRHERRWVLSLDERLLAKIRFWIRNNAVINRQPNMAAQTFCDYIIKEVLPEVAATKENAEKGYIRPLQERAHHQDQERKG